VSFLATYFQREVVSSLEETNLGNVPDVTVNEFWGSDPSLPQKPSDSTVLLISDGV
jgi:hypothetical protein